MGQTALITFIIIASVIFLIFITGLFVFVLEYRKRKIIFEKEKQIIALTSILQGQEEERARMAKDLHDGLGGMLSGIKLNLSSMKGNVIIQKEDVALFSKSISQLDSAIAEMRRVAHNMMPEALLKFGLSQAISDLCDDINESREINARFEHFNFNERVNNDIEIMIYRIVQELLNNAIKYSQGKNIIVQLSRNGNIILLTVEDDGKGFDITSLTNIKGTGLRNVRSRIEYLKGNWNIESVIGKGTSVNIEIPIENL